MKYCLDTDIIIEFFHGNEKVITSILQAESIGLFVTPITVAELFRGAYLSTHPSREATRIHSFLERCTILDFYVNSSETFGKISAQLTRSGNIIDDADLLIGCIALSQSCVLVTNNTKHFSRIPELKIENWTQ